MKPARIQFINPRLYFVYATILDSQPHLDSLTQRFPEALRIAREHPDATLYHSRYLEAAPNYMTVDLPIAKLKGIGVQSFQELGRIRHEIYQQLLQEKPDILQGLALSTSFRFFPWHGCSIILQLSLEGNFHAEHIVALVNGLMDHNGRVRLAGGHTKTLLEYVKPFYNRLLPQRARFGNKHSGRFCSGNNVRSQNYADEPVIYEKLSVIVPTALDPELPEASQYLEHSYLKCIAGVAIRRIEQFRELHAEVVKRVQKNTALFDRELLLLNFHNLLLYVNERNLPVSFYVTLFESLKNLSALLHHYDLSTYKNIARVDRLPTSYKAIRSFSGGLERTRFEAIQALNTYRMLTTATSTRVTELTDRGVKVFRLHPLEQGLSYRLEEIDVLLARVYSLRYQKKLQFLVIALMVLTLLATAIGVAGPTGVGKAISWFVGLLRNIPRIFSH